MSLIIGDNFSYLGAKPLDGRIKYNTLADMVAMADSTLYDGCFAYCVGTDKNYQWKSSNTVDATLGKWREFEAGGGSTGDSGVLYTVTLLASGWVSNSQTLTVTGLKADDNGVVGMLNTATDAQLEAARNAVITVTTQAANAVTFTCENEPEIDIPVGILIGGGSGGSGSGVPDGGTTGLDLRGTERVVGKLIESDGTVVPLYEKTITIDSITLPATGSTYSTKILDGSNIGLRNSFGTFVYDSVTMPINNILYKDAGEPIIYSDVRYRPASNGVLLRMGQKMGTASYTVTDVTITLQYTKA